MKKKTKIEELNIQYDTVCNEYLKLFCKKQGIDIGDTFWIADRVGEIVCIIEQYFFNLSDIKYDLNNKCPKGLIFEWQDYELEYHFKREKEGKEDKKVNYESYTKGFRHEMEEERLKKEKEEFEELLKNPTKEFVWELGKIESYMFDKDGNFSRTENNIFSKDKKGNLFIFENGKKVPVSVEEALKVDSIQKRIEEKLKLLEY